MFIEDYSENALQLATSTDGINYVYNQTVIVGGTAWKNPFIWFNPNDDQWYLDSHQTNGVENDIIVRHASTLEGLQSASDSIVVSRNQPFGSATMMYYSGRYWLLGEIETFVGPDQTPQWEVVAYYSTTLASSGFIEVSILLSSPKTKHVQCFFSRQTNPTLIFTPPSPMTFGTLQHMKST